MSAPRFWLLLVGVLLVSTTSAQTPTLPSVMVWVDREDMVRGCALQTELTVNGKLVDIFSAETQKAIDRQLQKGWNTIVLKTTAKADALQSNQLLFNFGVARTGAKKNQLEMDPILWEFRNGAGWELRDGKFVSVLDPKAKEITQTFNIYYAGLSHEPAKLQIKNGDFVLTAEARQPGSVPVLATVQLNGTTLNTFTGNRRNAVVTSLLKEGKNELRLITERVKDALADNDIRLLLAGPARWSAAKKMHEFPVVKELTTAEDWTRDAQTGLTKHRMMPELEKTERVFPFVLDEKPKAEAK